MNTIKTVGIIGAGAMGSGITQVALLAGNKVFLYDNQTNAAENATIKLKNTLEVLVQKGKISEDDLQKANANIFSANTLEELASCNLIVEAIVEILDVKKTLFASLEKIVSKECILATNTSSLSIAAISSACIYKERVIGLHFFNPAPIMPLVEVIPGVATKENLEIELIELMKHWNKIPVLAKDTPGFIVNRIARPFYGEALRIYDEGIADFATIDWAMKTYGGFKMGPFELMDFIGHDVNFRVTETVFEQMFFDAKYKPSITQKRLFEAGFYGRKSGRGYYDYTKELPNKPIENEELGQQIFNRIICMIINEAAEALNYSIANANDIELAMTKGVNYPKGLLQWANELGIKNVVNTLTNLQNFYGEERYRCSVSLKRMSEKDELFMI
jgi:3-hydroxybutyryl-CoA dehydrogenase